MPAMQISFAVEERVFKGLQARAVKMNLRAAQYAQRLFEAAYFVRVVQERGETAEDVALDRQVRQVFMLADCEAEFIAEAVGIPAARAEKILSGWRTYFAGEGSSASRGAPAAAQPAPPAGRPTPADGLAAYGKDVQARERPDAAKAEGAAAGAKTAAAPVRSSASRAEGLAPCIPPPVTAAGGYPVERIREMWAAGKSVKNIAEAIGKTEGAMSVWAFKHRDVCPMRRPKGARA